MIKEEKSALPTGNLRIANKPLEKVAGYGPSGDAAITTRNIAYPAAVLSARHSSAITETENDVPLQANSQQGPAPTCRPAEYCYI